MSGTDTQPSPLREWIGHDLVDDQGSRIGEISQVYVDVESGEGQWITVATGLFGSHASFVPLAGLQADGDRLVSPWDKGKVKDAPNIDADGELSADEEEALYRYYDLDYGAEAVDTTAGETDRTTDTGRDTSGPETDSAMTRSEEEAHVGTASREAGRVRLRKWVETEQQTITVPVRKERVELIREDITDDNVDAAMTGGDLTEEEHEVILSEEEIVVEKRVVPKERVRLDKNVEVEERQVETEVRKEHIEVEGDPEVLPDKR